MIRTKASLVKQIKPDSSFKLVKFDGTRKLPRTAPPTSGNKSESEDSEFERVFGDGPKKKKSKKNDKKEVTYQSARKEIINMGIAGSSSSKINLNEQLAIKLGAKPAKKAGRNYREILEEKRKLKELDKTVNKRTVFGTSASLSYRNQRKPGRRDGGLLKRYGKVEKADKERIERSNMKRKR